MSTVVILSIAVGIVLVLPIAWRVARRRFDPFEPILIFALAWGVMFVVRPIAIVVRDDTNFYGVDIGPMLDKSVLLGLVGAIAFVAGYEIVLGRRLAARLPRPAEGDLPPRTIVVAAGTGALGMVVFALFLLWVGGESAFGVFLRGRSSEFDDLLEGAPHYLLWLSLVTVPAALVAYHMAYSHRRPRDTLVALVLVGLVLLRTVPTGGRLYLLMLVGGMLVLPYLYRRKRPGVRALALGLVVALAASYALLGFRDEETRGSFSASISRLASSPERALLPVVKGPDAEMAPALAGALLVIPDRLPFRFGGATVGDLVTRPVPRRLWDGKPEPHTLRVTEEVWPVARETGNFNPAFTPLLSFYWDFGLVGVVLGMACYGVFARLAYEYLLRGVTSPTAQLVYALAMWTVVIAARYDPVLLFMHCLIMFVPLLAMVSIGSRSENSSRAYLAEGAARR